MAPRKKRGAQPGNKNALKHGFYARGFERDEITDLNNYVDPGIESEIILLRVTIRRLFKLAKGCDDLRDMMRLANTIGNATVSMATAIRTQRLIAGDPNDEFRATIDQVLRDVVTELDLKL